MNRTLLGASILTMFGSASLGMLIQELCSTTPRKYVVIVTFLLFLIPIGSAYFLRNTPGVTNRRYRTNRLRKDRARKRPILVSILSSLPPTGQAIPAWVNLTGDLSGDLAALAARKREHYHKKTKSDFWSWEQLLRGVEYQLADGNEFKRWILIASSDSIRQIHQLTNEVLVKYPVFREGKVQVEFLAKNHKKLFTLKPGEDYAHHEDAGFDFEDFDQLTYAFNGLFDRELADVPKDQIQIDFTGGQKPASVVAAVVTLLSRASNQYVATNPSDFDAPVWTYDVWGYDFREEVQPQD